MGEFRWFRAALYVYGSLACAALGVSALLHLLGLVPLGSEGATIYWLVALPSVVFFGAWLLLVIWCFVDAEQLGMNAPLWALLVLLLGFPLGFLVYLLLRHRDRPMVPED